MDDRFDLEAEVLADLGVEQRCIAMEDIVDGAVEAALDGCGLHEAGEGDGAVLYRGWMLTEDEYGELDEALVARDHHLVVDPEAYLEAHQLPRCYEALRELTVETRWIWGADLDEAWEAAQSLGDAPWVLKDHVKSAKERFGELSLIPAGVDRGGFERICRAFMEHRGERFEGGLLFRRFVQLQGLSVERAGQEPRDEEYRLFFWQGELVSVAPYHDVDGDPGLELPGGRWREPLARYARELPRRVASPFFSADIARRADGSWILLEVGDGGVSALPPRMHPGELYAPLFAAPR